ncbi:MAG: molybdopterin-synthase adenylyltransferase MoeB [Euryarchaeota archaeon TMED99]|nr:MAG: molybdopterin-synthase adenylyltransferase MoeB [Euryarchaeota archaeon TMED99]
MSESCLDGLGLLVDIDVQRYARHISLPQVGLEGQRKLNQSRVLVIGAGGLGSPALLYLAAAGIGHIGVVDDDVVDLSNLQRQVIHSTATIGQLKVESASNRLLELNPGLTVSTYGVRLSPENIESILAEGWDVVIDGTDNLPTRYLLDDACFLKNIPWVYGSIYRFEGQVSVFNFKQGPCYRDLFSEVPPPQSVPSCEQGGVLGVLPGVIGSLQANEAIKIILGLGEVLNGRLLLYDAESMNFQTLRFSHNSERETIHDLSLSAAMFDDDAWCMRLTGVGDVDEGDTSSNEMMFKSISMKEFAKRRDTGWTPFILDVRSTAEYEQAHTASTDLQIDHESVASMVESIPKDREVVVLCRSGMRSQMAAMYLIQAGYDGSFLYNLEGGIMAWQSVRPDEIIHG